MSTAEVGERPTPRNWKWRLVAPGALIVRWMVGALGRTYRYRVRDQDNLMPFFEPDRAAVICLWHDQIASAVDFVVRYALPRGLRLTLLASHSRDGELIARVVKAWKVDVVRGSASRGGAEAMRGMYRSLTRHRSSPVLLPDGPRGPQYRAKPGAVLLSQLAQVPILPIGFRPESSWRLGSWDRMHVPRPFSRIEVCIGKPMQVPREVDEAGRRQQIERLEHELDRLVGRR